MPRATRWRKSRRARTSWTWAPRARGRTARRCAESGAALLVMHGTGEPEMPQLDRQWPDVMAELERFFTEKLDLAARAGLPADAVILNPGPDFAKQRAANPTVLRELGRLRRFGLPVLVPVSRKTVVAEVLGLADPADRDADTIACLAAAMRRGGDIFRVHDVDAAWQAVKTLHAIYPRGVA